MPAKAEKHADSAKTAAHPVQARPPQKGDHIFLVDGSSYIFRAYHALPPLHRKSDGLQVNAVLGFCNMLWKLLRDMKPEERPTHLAVVFDKSEKTFRNEMYSEYKANRTEPPDDLRPQFGLIREAVRAFDLPCLEQSGFEADDLIATYVRLACEADASATIVASDKDLMQLVNDCVIMYDTMKDIRIGIPEVVEKFGVPPTKVIEVQALIGDSTDNVPGVPGIGVKTAAQLIQEFGDLETLLARAGEIKQDKRREALVNNAEAARLSKQLVTLDQNVPLEVPIADLAVHEPDYPNLIPFLQKMGFKTLAQRVADKAGSKAAIPAAPATASAPSAKKAKAESSALPVSGTGDLFTAPKTFPKAESGNVVLTPMALALKRAEELRASKFDPSKYQCVDSIAQLQKWIGRAYDTGTLAIKAETNSIDPMRASLCGIALAVDVNEACYVPLGHRQAEEGEAGDTGGLFEAKLCEGQIPEREALAALKQVFEDISVLKIGHDIKQDILILAQRGVTLTGTD